MIIETVVEKHFETQSNVVRVIIDGSEWVGIAYKWLPEEHWYIGYSTKSAHTAVAELCATLDNGVIHTTYYDGCE